MMGLAPWHWIVVLLIVLMLFGTGKISGLMGDFAKGIKSFKKNMAEDESMEASADRPAGTIAAPHAGTAPGTTTPVRETVTTRG